MFIISERQPSDYASIAAATQASASDTNAAVPELPTARGPAPLGAGAGAVAAAASAVAGEGEGDGDGEAAAEAGEGLAAGVGEGDGDGEAVTAAGVGTAVVPARTPWHTIIAMGSQLCSGGQAAHNGTMTLTIVYADVDKSLSPVVSSAPCSCHRFQPAASPRAVRVTPAVMLDNHSARP